MSYCVLAVDDDKNLLELLKMRLESSGYEVYTASDEENAIEAVKKRFFDLAIIDMQLAGGSGIDLMENLKLMIPDMPVIILTAYGSIETAVEAMKKGAFNYLTKPFDPRNLLLQVERALENRRLNLEIKNLKEFVSERFSFSNIIAKSEKMRRILDQVYRVAKTDSTIYIHGESGTGKELIAKVIHYASDRQEKQFLAINCAAIPETLLESELFGYEKGAFTGAVRNSKGLFVQANEGTIFLDEIGDMPVSIQAKLLRVLQEKKFYPLGSEKPKEVDVRVIVATNKDLKEEVKKGSFREDLFYRIHVIPIYLPPLRERKEDMPSLIDHFLKNFSKKMEKDIKGLTPTAMQKLLLYDWPGNIRELENTIEYAVAMTQQNIVSEDLILPAKAMTLETLAPFKDAKDNFEKEYLIRLLEVTAGNISKAASFAKKYRADLYNLFKKHNIKPERYKKAQTPTDV